MRAPYRFRANAGIHVLEALQVTACLPLGAFELNSGVCSLNTAGSGSSAEEAKGCPNSRRRARCEPVGEYLSSVVHKDGKGHRADAWSGRATRRASPFLLGRIGEDELIRSGAWVVMPLHNVTQ